MNKKKLFISLGIILLILGCVFVYYFVLRDDDNLSLNNKIDTNIGATIEDDDIDWSKYESSNIVLNNENITIKDAGVYYLSGSIDAGNIKINTGGNVKLVLDNVTISNSSGPAIEIEKANIVVISTTNDSVNTLSDCSSYSSSYDEDVEGAIYSKDDLVLEGEGTLIINGNKGDGIVSKDNIKINSGTYKITSSDDGIRGKDSVYIVTANMEINAGGDGIKSTNESDSNLGYIKIINGTFNIVAVNDGIQAESKLLIDDGTFNITTGGGASNSSDKYGWGKWGNNSVSSDSAKGLKAGDNIVITNGFFELNTSDDAIHSNNYILISAGTYSISSGDDGVHADNDLIIDDGSINISKSYEGLEANNITINGGDISIVSSDDGINAAGGNDGSANNRPGASPNMSYSSNSMITINNGNIVITASGDGIDSNGSIYVNGGTIYVNGPEDNGNGALDYDGDFVITSGEIIAIGSSGMAQGIGDNSTQYGMLVYLSNTYSSGTSISIRDTSDNEIISYTSMKSFSSIVFSSDKLIKNNTYNIYINDDLCDSVTISSINTTSGNSSNMGMNIGSDSRRGPRR